MCGEYLLYEMFPVTLFVIIPLLVLGGWTAVQIVKSMTVTPMPVAEKEEQHEPGLQPSKL